MASWSTQRRLFYLGIVVGALLLVLSIPTYFFLNQPESCFDGKQNQNEVGIDCGGSCTTLCSSEVAPLITHWSRYFKGARAGFYDAVAFIENTNVNASVKDIGYTFKLYNRDGILVALRSGRTYINPNERFVIFEAGVETKEQVPVRAQFAFSETPHWEKFSAERPQFLVQDKRLDVSSVRPSVKATIMNRSLIDYDHVVVTALLYDDEDNVSVVSKTEINHLPKSSSSEVTLLLPYAPLHIPTRMDIMPRLNTTL